MAPNACAPNGPLTEHNLPPERTESAAASERYATRDPTETVISGQAPSVARPRTCQYPRVQRPREPTRYAPSEAAPKTRRHAASDGRPGMQPDGSPRRAPRRGPHGGPSAVEGPNFRTACERVDAAATWKGQGPEDRRRALARYCGSILDRRLDQIRRADVIAILTPLMAEKRAMGSKLHGWIRGALAWGVAREHLECNVADGIGAALPAARKGKKHHAALPYAEVGAALEAIAACTASEVLQVLKSCLRFIILTAVRSGEARGGTWSEMDLQAAG